VSAKTWRVRVDPTRCSGRGLCAELVPELIGMDDWGYPILSDTTVEGDVLRHARRAVAACPELALFLEPVRGGSRRGARFRGPGVGVAVRGFRPGALRLLRKSQLTGRTQVVGTSQMARQHASARRPGGVRSESQIAHGDDGRGERGRTNGR
jgi:ferredoxin